MATRTRKAAATPPAKKATAKKTTGRTPRKTTTARKTPALSLVKDNPGTATVVDLRHPLPVRRRAFVGTHTRPQIVEARAALASAMAQLPVPHLLWLTQIDGRASATLTDGTQLIHTHERAPHFTALVRCPTGGLHAHTVTNTHDLNTARAITGTCGRRHNDTTPEAGGPDWHKAATRGVQQLVPAHLSRLGDGLTAAKAAVADTQPMHLAAIAAALRAEDQMKEHPQP